MKENEVKNETTNDEPIENQLSIDGKMQAEKPKYNKDDVKLHKDTALNKLNIFLDNYIADKLKIGNADKLSYWIENYVTMLSFEKSFNPSYNKNYERGDILKVNLGYNIGNEEGGLHYCVVIDNKNQRSSGIITVIPLSSYKGKDLHYSEVNIGTELFDLTFKKCKELQSNLKEQVTQAQISEPIDDKIYKDLQEKLGVLNTMIKELSKMKAGSIALVSQITTVSKIRIYDPQHTGDILDGIKLSETSLDLINNKIKELFIKK